MSVAEETAAVVDQLPPHKAQSVLDFAKFLASAGMDDQLLISQKPTVNIGTALSQRLLKRAGTVNDLPADMAQQHDHYIHGTPKN